MTHQHLCVTLPGMVGFAAMVLFAWGATAAGYGAYTAWAALSAESTFHAAQAGVALLIATVSFSAGFLVLILGRLGRVPRPPREPKDEQGDI